MGLFVKLDANWVDNDKVIEVGLDGAGLHAVAMCLAKRMDTDGVLSTVVLGRYGATTELIDRLVTAELFDRIDDRRVAVHDWLDRNPAVVDYSAAARAGNHKRWQHRGPVDACSRCNPELAPESPPIGGDEATNTPDSSTEPPLEPLQPVDNQDNGKTPSSVAIKSGATPKAIGGESQRDRPRILESESETETETESESKPPSRARTVPTSPPPPVDNDLDDAELAAREALTHITQLHRRHHPPEATP